MKSLTIKQLVQMRDRVTLAPELRLAAKREIERRAQAAVSFWSSFKWVKL